jgi:putative hydrolase of the HAD superfamily
VARVQAVVLDAVGTLIHPDPPAPIVYARVGQQFGSRLPPAEIRERLMRAFGKQEELDRLTGWRTSEDREIRRWRSIVGEVLNDANQREQCFQILFEHFSKPSAWRLEPDASITLRALKEGGLKLGLASNYDRRLRQVVAGLPALDVMNHVFISSEITWRKPAREFFSSILHAMSLPPESVLFVGDDPVNDYRGAIAAGMHSLLLNRAGTAPDGVTRVGHISDLTRMGL